MTELQRQFIDETGVSFDGIPINGIHLQYITWLEAQMQALRIHDAVGRSEQLHLCPVCGEMAGKSYLLSKLPTICQKCDHAWDRA